MDVTVLLVIVFVVMLVGFVATIMVGKSKSNQEENSQYMQKTGTKWLRLTWLYIVTILAIVLIFVALVK
jgi:NADH:ubiquinone oxidoreductase subunit 3 (subunit A)